MNRKIYLLFLTSVFTLLFSFNSFAKGFNLKNQSQAKAIYVEASKNKSSNPWYFTNLYSKENNSFFIPYQLWSGSKWNGNKNIENCMHNVKNKWVFKRADRERKNRVLAPVDYKVPDTDKIVKTFKVENKRTTQHYICHEKGLARIYDSRFAEAGTLKELKGKECKFPAGFGWKIAVSTDCSKSSPKETKVISLTFDNNYILTKMSYTYEKKEGRKTSRKNDFYEYEPNKGRVFYKKYK